MTAKEKIKEMLIERGTFTNLTIEKIINETIARIEKITPERTYEWNGPAEQFSEQIYHAIWVQLSAVTLEWIDKNYPKAFFRQFFE